MGWLPVRDILRGSLKRLGLDEKVQEKNIEDAWMIIAPDVLGKKNAQRSCAISFANGVLTVQASSSAQASDIALRAPALLKMYQQRFPEDGIQHIKVVIAP